MKKKRLSFVCILLCMSLLIMPIPASATNQTTAVDEIAAKSMAQAPALEAFNKIYDLVIFDTAETPEYHDYYGGCYINDDNILVICVKNGGTELINTLNAVLGDEYDVEYDFCDWSKGEVLSFAESEINTFSAKSTVTVNSGYYSAQDNAYILEVTNTSEEPILPASAKRTGNIPVIIREVDMEQAVDASPSIQDAVQTSLPERSNIPIYGGMGMHQKATYGNLVEEIQNGATLALCGYFNGIPCILTAAHCCLDTEDLMGNSKIKKLYLDSNFTVELEETSLQVHGVGDYAALKIPSGYIPTNSIKATSSGSTRTITSYLTLNEIPQGTIIYKYGISTSYTESQVFGNNATTGDGSQVSGLILSIPVGAVEGDSDNEFNDESIVDEGDSGGPVWTLNANGGIVLVGLVQAMGNPAYFATSRMYITPICYPISSGFIPYGMLPVF